MPNDSLIAHTIGSLINGVSQQPRQIRLDSQGELQENGLSSVVDGVSKRPPSEHIALVQASPPTGGYFVHTIDRDADEQYIVLLKDSGIEIYDVDGNAAATINVPDGVGYLNFDSGTYNADEVFAAVSVADNTFIVNKQTAVAMSGSPSTDRPNEFLLFIKETPALAITYDFDIDGTTASSSSTNNQETEVHVDDILANALTVGNFANWTFTKVGQNVIHAEQTGNTGTPEPLESLTNSWGDSGYTLAYKTIQRFSDLPPKGVDGFTVEIVGDEGNTDASYWVKFVAGEEYWLETVKPGLDDTFDASTMPLKLTRITTSPLEFTLAEATWDNRLKGDDFTAPEPTFVGRKITDSVFHKNRLGFTSDESIILSESGEFFNFWPTTVSVVVESDPIDASGSNNRVGIIDWAVPYDGNLTLFSGRGHVQNELLGVDDTLKLTDAVIAERGAWESSEIARPFALNQAIYFVVDRVTASGIMEYTVAPNERVLADEVTSHLPTYIPGNVRVMTGSSIENTIALISEDTDEDHRIYVYRTYFNGAEKIMSSWSRWSFAAADVILHAAFLQCNLILLVQRQDGIHLEKICLRQLDDSGLGFRCHLDSLVELTGSYAAGTGLTTWTIPYDQATNGGDYQLVLADAAWGNDLGRVLTDADFSTDTTVTAEGDWSANPVLIGRKYLFEYEFTKPVLRQGNDSFTQGRLQLKRWKILFKDTGDLNVRVEHREDDTIYEYPIPAILIDGAGTIGPPTLLTDEHEFDVQGKNDDLIVTAESNSYLPVTIVNAEWLGHLVTHSSRG